MKIIKESNEYEDKLNSFVDKLVKYLNDYTDVELDKDSIFIRENIVIYVGTTTTITCNPNYNTFYVKIEKSVTDKLSSEDRLYRLYNTTSDLFTDLSICNEIDEAFKSIIQEMEEELENEDEEY